MEGDFVEIRFTVEPNYEGWRLDRYLCVKIRRLSRTRVQRIIERSVVPVEPNRPLKPSTLLKRGMTFVLRRPAHEEPEVPPPSELKEVYLDEQVLVLDKPAGLPIHATARYAKNTMVAQVDGRYGKDFAAPAHRLDRETSGLMVFGRGAEVCERLMRSFISASVKKEYLAILEGQPPEGVDEFEVDAPISEGTDLIRIAVKIDEAGKPARTEFVVERRFERDGARFALVRCFPRTGRQHQIRIHASHAGFPLVGDKMYGPDPGYFDRFSKGTLEDEGWARLRLERHALHAARLSFPHPASGKVLTFESALPKDLREFVEVEAAHHVP
jgi:23S rRNA pseudouridine1911/1915/1917 synthase